MQGSSLWRHQNHRGWPAHDVRDQAALAALCAALDRAVQAYHADGLKVREVVVLLEEADPALGQSDVTPVYVDVYDSGYGHGI